MALFPFLPEARPLEGLDATDYYAYTPLNVLPGVTLNARYSFNTNNIITLAHELGHALGLFHVFSKNGCGTGDDYCADTPDYDYTAFTAGGGNMTTPRTACDGSSFYSYNIMDYNGCGLHYPRPERPHPAGAAIRLVHPRQRVRPPTAAQRHESTRRSRPSHAAGDRRTGTETGPGDIATCRVRALSRRNVCPDKGQRPGPPFKLFALRPSR